MADDITIEVVEQVFQFDLSGPGADLAAHYAAKAEEDAGEAEDARDEAVEAKDQALVAKAEMDAAVAVIQASVLAQLVPTDDGLVPTEVDSDGRVLRGRWMSGAAYEPVLDAALAEQRVQIAPDDYGRFPILLDQDNRILSRSGFSAALQPAEMEMIYPNDARLLVSDYDLIQERSATRLRFGRSLPSYGGDPAIYYAPAARVGFVTRSRAVRFAVSFSTLVSDALAVARVAVILADGVKVGEITHANGTRPIAAETTVTFATATARRVELVWQSRDTMDLLEIGVEPGVGLGAAARPNSVLLTYGDSITDGYSASDALHNYASLTAEALGLQLVNMGYGGRSSTAADGALMGAKQARLTTHLMGANDFYANRSAATVQSNVTGFITGFRGAHPTGDLVLITPLNSPNANAEPANSGGATYEDIRQAVRNAHAAFPGDANLHLIEGPTLLANTGGKFVDGLHPNDAGFADQATALTPLLAALL